MNTDTITIRRRAKFHSIHIPSRSFSSAEVAAAYMLGFDTEKYEFSVGGVYHRFLQAEVKAVQKQIETRQAVRAKAKVRAMGLGR